MTDFFSAATVPDHYRAGRQSIFDSGGGHTHAGTNGRRSVLLRLLSASGRSSRGSSASHPPAHPLLKTTGFTLFLLPAAHNGKFSWIINLPIVSSVSPPSERLWLRTAGTHVIPATCRVFIERDWLCNSISALLTRFVNV